ncbi:DNA-binding transcriptional regulator, XRE-family HTH domain [Fontibacillus panacisegetis]|uniref:DNA-binding transcriptional regulator, XRE-family HTH domain n=1 Tax=Fontibacillus panacisegetis TaxID=670482 RepID=A0A1G7S499_9BACL|nr:helix-turn-helix transcriptional regulator [Fontibacillus panacisegetis]SDG17877.1 DNA-binding transcriptional regulator, XRE-family HTH domain [Fontibacillus panacisegetis]
MENLQLAKRIRAFRKLKGYTQQELAERSGISLDILGAIERGNRRAEDQILNKIADVLGVTLTDLMVKK